MVYFYIRVSRPSDFTKRFKRSRNGNKGVPIKVILPIGQNGLSEEVFCDPCFQFAISIAVAQTAHLKTYVLQLVENQPKMVTRPR
jgi:hypothetical protein